MFKLISLTDSRSYFHIIMPNNLVFFVTIFSILSCMLSISNLSPFLRKNDQIPSLDWCSQCSFNCRSLLRMWKPRLEMKSSGLAFLCHPLNKGLPDGIILRSNSTDSRVLLHSLCCLMWRLGNKNNVDVPSSQQSNENRLLIKSKVFIGQSKQISCPWAIHLS